MNKEQFVDAVLEEMSKTLTTEELQKLELVLVTHLRDVRIEQEHRELVVSDRSWEKPLRTWIATKRLENCSNGTLSNYYRAIRMLLERLNRKLQDITTNDLRYYIAVYQ